MRTLMICANATSVSVDVDRRLTENLAVPIRLRPDEWRSGDILWLVDAVGDGRVVQQFVIQLAETALRGRNVKCRRLGPNGMMEVQCLNALLVPELKSTAHFER